MRNPDRRAGNRLRAAAADGAAADPLDVLGAERDDQRLVVGEHKLVNERQHLDQRQLVDESQHVDDADVAVLEHADVEIIEHADVEIIDVEIESQNVGQIQYDEESVPRAPVHDVTCVRAGTTSAGGSMTMNPLANDPEMLGELRDRVARRDWQAARRLTQAMQLHRSDPQQLFERDEAYLMRMARRERRGQRKPR